MKFFLLAVVFFNFSSYCWSVIGVFKTVNQRDLLQYRILQISSLLVWSYSLYTIWISSEVNAKEINTKIVTLSLIQIFCAISFWKLSRLARENEFTLAFSKDQPQKLVKKFFYERVRHPFYMIYLLSYYSIAITFMDGLGFTLCLIMNVIYFRAAKLEESKFLNSDLASEYIKYMKETWMFFPKIKF